MLIRAGSVSAYRRALHTVGAQAATYVSNVLGAEQTTDVAAMREVAIAAISDAIGAQGDVAQALSMQMYDMICEAERIHTEPARLFDGVIDRKLMVEKVHYYARHIVEGMRERFDRECADLAEYYVKRCAYENTVRNCDANNVRYARIPTGDETCEFCVMLASRGFVYHTEATARGAHGVHRNCDCIVLPGARGKTTIAGYDPTEWYARWAESGFKGSGSGSRYGRSRRYEPTMGAEDSMRLQRKLLRGLSKADRDTAMDIILDANEEWSKNSHDVDVHNHFAERVQRAMMDNRITNSDLAERARERHLDKRESGATYGAYSNVNDPDYIKRDAHADRYYEELRKRDEDAEVARVAANTGIGEAVVRQAYSHIFTRKHDLESGHDYFDADYDMSQSWQRISAGVNIQPHDLTLVYHEAIEDDFMYLSGLPYREAHDATCALGYDWAKECDVWKLENGLM